MSNKEKKKESKLIQKLCSCGSFMTVRKSRTEIKKCWRCRGWKSEKER